MLTGPPNCPGLSPVEHLLDLVDKLVRFMNDLNELLLTSWTKYHRGLMETFRGLVESMALRVRAILVA